MQLRLLSISLSLSILGIAFNGSVGVGQNQKESRYYFCGKHYDESSQIYSPATIAWNPEQQKNKVIIFWKSEYFGQKWNPQRRCDVVSKKFQKLHESGNLNYLTLARKIGTNIICGVKEEGDTCTESNYLFTINPNHNPGTIYNRLYDIFGGRGRGPIYQQGANLYIKVDLNLAEDVNNP